VPRILCLDYGERHTGVALSDETKTIAQGQPTIHHDSPDELIRRVRQLIAEHEVDDIVIGLPVGRTGAPSARSRKVEEFGKRLAAATGVKVAYFSERFSTARANEVLEEVYGGTGRKKDRRQAVDKVAATIILEDYLAAGQK
jgi:putative pre-16S rRNA nuclease